MPDPTTEWEIIRDSCLFDRHHYLRENRDVAAAGMDPIEHYLLFGAAEGRNPSRWFNTAFYLDTYPDVARAGLNPLVHYILYGQGEGRTPGPERAKPDKDGTPRLSVVVVAHDMPRELPRTMRSLSPAMQRDIAPEDYEIIVVDNASAAPADEVEIHRWGGQVFYHRLTRSTASPVPAVNYGLEQARGDLVGAFVDGARLASPGLLSSALAAAEMEERPVIGVQSLDLGPDLQGKSLRQGYDQEYEDRMLEAVDWSTDGYRLFAVAGAFGGEGGWRTFPTETNALFLRREHWRELGGLDVRFGSAGGGLVNLDIWKRLAENPPSGCVTMLLGEAVFHQFHGGISTNSPNPPFAEWHEEYRRIRGEPYSPPRDVPCRWFLRAAALAAGRQNRNGPGGEREGANR